MFGGGLCVAVYLFIVLFMEMVVFLVFFSRVGLVLMVKERVMWDTNFIEMFIVCG